MTGYKTNKMVLDFVNPNCLANMVESSGAAQAADHVTLSDDAALGWDLDADAGILAADIKWVEFVARAAATPVQDALIFIGLGDHLGVDNDWDNIANRVGFQCLNTAAGGALDVQAVVASPAADSGAQATGFVLGTSWQRFRLSLWERVVTGSPPAASTGGRASVLASCGNADGYVRPIITAAHLDISGWTGTLQPLVTVTGATQDVDLKEITIAYAAR